MGGTAIKTIICGSVLLILASLLAACGGGGKGGDDPEPDLITIFGVILDSRGNPVPGAEVRVENTTTSTTTDAQGRFTLEVRAGEQRISVTRDGHTHSVTSISPSAGALDLGAIGPTDPFYVWFLDRDGDGHGIVSDVVASPVDTAPPGYAAAPGDCDDGLASVYPGATEVCNGIDDSCDGQVDEGVLVSFYLDFDGDGFGDAAMPEQACAASPGYVADARDCNDTLATVYPGAAEICNGIDDSCDGQVDENLPTQTVYRDADRDLFGDPDVTQLACGNIPGYITEAGDCDDSDARLNPDTLWYPDADIDLYPGETSPVAACLAPSPDLIAEFLVGAFDCNDADPTIHPNASEVPDNGIDDDCDPLTPDTTAFAQAELAGIYATHVLALGRDPMTFQQPTIWASGRQTYDAEGRLLAQKLGPVNLNFTFYGGDASLLGPERLALAPSGAVSAPDDRSLQGLMGADDRTLTLLSDLGDDGFVLRLLTRVAENIGPGTLVGGWIVHDLNPGGGLWRRGAMLVDADGAVDANFEFSTVPGFVLPESGATLLDPEGGVTLFLGGNVIPMAVSDDGELLVGAYTERGLGFDDRLMLAVRADPLGYQGADLAGQWSFSAIGMDSTGGFYRALGRGTFEVDAGGNASVLFQRWRDTVVDLPEGFYLNPPWRKPAAAFAEGLLTLDPLGVVSHAAMPDFAGGLSRDRNLLVATYLTPTFSRSPVLLIAQRRRAGPTAVVSADEARAVQATIDPNVGGSLQATAEDGTQYRLELPVGTLDRFGFSETLTLAPLASTAGTLPDGGLTGGVRVGPDGLRFFEPATLTVTPLSDPTAGPVLGFNGGTGGADRFDFQHARVQAPNVVLNLGHLSAYYTAASSCATQTTDRNLCYALEVSDAARYSSDPRNDSNVRDRAVAWLENSILPGLEGPTNTVDQLIEALAAVLELRTVGQLHELEPMCDWIGPTLATRLAAANQSAVNAVEQSLEQDCLQQPDGDCQKLFLLREFQRLLGIAQASSDFGTADACFELPVPDPDTFCAGALFTEPADLDIEPNPAAVVVDGNELLFTTVRSAAGSPMSGRQVALSVLPGGEDIFDVIPGGLVLGLAPGAGTLRGEVVDACVEVTADVFVAPAATGRWSVSTTERRIGSSRQECQDNQLPLDYTVDFSIDGPDPAEPGSLGVTWSEPFGGGFFSGNLWAHVLRVGGIRRVVTPGGVFDANLRCEVLPLGAESGTGTCDWSWIDLGGGCFGQDDITIERLGPTP